MKTEIIAKAKSGKEIACAVEIDEKGNIKTQYPVEFLNRKEKSERGYSILLNKKQAEILFNRNCPFETVNILIEDHENWADIKMKAREIKADFEKSESRKFWEKCLRENTTLHLSCVEGRNEISGLPEALKDKNSLLVMHIKKTAKSEKVLTAGELASWIKTLEQQIANKNDAHKLKLMQKAKETGRPQVLKSASVEYNSHREHWSEDRYVTYINEDGTEFTEEVKTEPDHY